MAGIPTLEQRDEFNQLTTELALQLLERRATLSDREHALVQAALQATDRLSARLLERGARASAPGGLSTGRAPSGPR